MKITTLLTCLFTSLPTMINAQQEPAPETTPPTYFEIRTYHANEGKLEDLHSRFRDHTCALFTKHKMTNIIYLQPTEKDNNSMTYLLGYPSKEQRDASWDAFRKDPDWVKAYAESQKNGKLVKSVESNFYTLTDYSPKFSPQTQTQTQTPNTTNHLFELRTYTTNNGKLDNLDARFRDHTCALFAKHGMKNIIYLHPAAGEKGHSTTLKYIVAHQDLETRNASFKAFSQDPAWKKASKDSEKDGKILIKGGVKNSFHTPTDYSPLK
ncbi:MAG: NIPSNAP family protein [Akkermansiaceae bacterium]